MGQKLTERELDKAMDDMDADKSGEVDLEEFTEWFNRAKKSGAIVS